MASPPATSPASNRFALQDVPVVLVANLCSFLTGFDAFNLSHTSSWWGNYFSDGSFWRKCLRGVGENHQESEQLWKKQYAQSRSMLFKGLKVDDRTAELDAFLYWTNEREQRRSDRHFQLTRMGTENFSFDVWFSLLPATEGDKFGGIILGLQSSTRESGRWPHYHQQFVMVSSRGELYCSVLSRKHVVVSDLQPKRWYHLALTYDHDTQQQLVYLDGNNISSEVGPRHHEWGCLTYSQVGTGCITSDTLHCPHRGYIGWYGLHGVVEAFCVWKGVLSQDQVKTLASFGQIPTTRPRASAKPQQAGNSLGTLQLNVQMVKCTRPAEGPTMQLVK
ncbi:hypothetical protein PHYPSEUDO_007875 [Phytophthora pseudosyringae]|uniref:LamG-like jellyroll fold domain-containing protein n=1 Tax=Phytophthora pseudosyringae TaxID=221518 RepID=A0A8T1VFH8_9STRA|nr:hypothetical protein PHYPSEUDO_007875 [Phytophthora pseudosyringae]